MGSLMLKLTKGGVAVADWAVRIQGVGEDLTDTDGKVAIDVSTATQSHASSNLIRGTRLATALSKSAGSVTDMASRYFVEYGDSYPPENANNCGGTSLMLTEDVEVTIEV